MWKQTVCLFFVLNVTLYFHINTTFKLAQYERTSIIRAAINPCRCEITSKDIVMSHINDNSNNNHSRCCSTWEFIFKWQSQVCSASLFSFISNFDRMTLRTTQNEKRKEIEALSFAYFIAVEINEHVFELSEIFYGNPFWIDSFIYSLNKRDVCVVCVRVIINTRKML